MKTDYNKVFDSLCKSKSVKAHFNALNKIYLSTTDNKLKNFLNAALSNLLDPKYLKNSTPIPLSKSSLRCFVDLLEYCKAKNKTMYYRQSRDTFIRSIGEYGYIKSQLTKHDRTYTQESQAFLEVLSREPQSLEELSIKACEYFEDVIPADIQNDMREFLDSLVADRYLVSGETAEECAAKDTYFSYAENPKTLEPSQQSVEGVGGV